VGDRMTGLALLSGVLAAVIAAQKTGRGKLVETSLLRTGVFAAGTDLALQMARGRVGSNKPRHENINPYFGFYPTRDGRWMAVQIGRAADLPTMLGHPELAGDPRFVDLAARSRHINEVYRFAGEELAKRPTKEWLALFDDCEIPAGPMNSLDDLMDDPHLDAICFFRHEQHPTEGEIVMPDIPVRFSDSPADIRRLQPRFGEHGREILLEAGLEAAEIDAAVSSGGLVFPVLANGGAPDEKE
jgi:crotonobetainyl-CoA:carnitine CoA-transferase CaiB-like acyl-CoA transferase